MISDKIRLIQPWINNFPRKIGTTFRTCCLTQDPENLLMWSHYSDSHKGLVLGFEFDDNVNKRIHNVDYSKEKYELGIECCYGTKFPQEFMNSVLLRKSDIWDYEDEVRIIMLKKELKNMSDDMFGLEFNNINIKRIILGSKVDISILHEINGLIEDQYNHIKPEIALLQQNEYKIRIDDLNKSINQYIQEREKNDQFYEEYIVANN